MSTLKNTGATILIGSILVCDPAEGVKNQTMSPHHGHGDHSLQDTNTNGSHSSSSFSERDQKIWDGVFTLSKLTQKEGQALINQYSSLPENDKKSAQQDITRKKVDYMHKISSPSATQEEKSDASRLKAIEDLKGFILQGKYPKNASQQNNQPSQTSHGSTTPPTSSAPPPSPSSATAPSSAESHDQREDTKGAWTNTHAINVIYLPMPGKNVKDGKLTLIVDNKEKVAHPIILESNPLVIPAGSLQAIIPDLSDAHHNKEGKVIDENGKVVPSGSIKSPDGFETYIDRNPLPPGIGVSFSYIPVQSVNNGTFAIQYPNLTHIIVGLINTQVADYLKANNIMGEMYDAFGSKITLADINDEHRPWGCVVLVYAPSK